MWPFRNDLPFYRTKIVALRADEKMYLATIAARTADLQRLGPDHLDAPEQARRRRSFTRRLVIAQRALQATRNQIVRRQHEALVLHHVNI